MKNKSNNIEQGITKVIIKLNKKTAMLMQGTVRGGTMLT
jgi:hypothetical protein